jgi:hypothetical protein
MKKVIFAIVIAGGVMLTSCGGSIAKEEVSMTDTTKVDSTLCIKCDTMAVLTTTVDTVKTK